MKESNQSPFKKETKEDVRAGVERDINRLKNDVEEARYQLNGVLTRIDAQNTKAQDLLRKDPNSEVDLEVLSSLASLQEERDALEKSIAEKESAIAQLQVALNNNN